MTTDPLNEDLSAMDTSFPLVVPAIYDLKVEKSDIVPTKKGGEQWKLEIKNLNTATSTDGAVLAPLSVTIFDQTGFGEKSAKFVAMRVQALHLTGVTLRTIKDWYKQAEGKTFRAKVGIDAGGTDPNTGKTYGPKNTIEAWLKN